MITKLCKDFSFEEVYKIQQMGGAAFFDRDGTINVDFGHVYRPEDLVFVEGIPEIIRIFNEAGVYVIVVTNQAGVAKGLYTEKDMHRFNCYMNEQLRTLYNAHIDAFYFCPHHPDFTGSCLCRKPKSGLFFQAAKAWDIVLTESVMYGDNESDRIAAEGAGIKIFFLIDDAVRLCSHKCINNKSKIDKI